MTRGQPKQRHIDVPTYLEREEQGQIRHEYIEGEIYAMTGATVRHARIVGNLFVKLATSAAGGSCRAYTNDVKVQPAADVFYYPDVVVACEPQDQDSVVAAAPCLIVEVTSRSSVRIDRGEKADAYRRIDSLRAYLVVDQSRKRVTRHWRDVDGTWLVDDTMGSGSVDLPCPMTTLTLDQIYDGVQIPARLGEPDFDEAGAYVVEAD